MSRHVTAPCIAVAVALFLAAAPADAQDGGMVMLDTHDLEWAPLELPGFDSGLRVTVLHGDPTAADRPYTLRLLFPDGYRFPAHWHPRTENLTVISGTFYLAMGGEEEWDRVRRYIPGDFIYAPARVPHFGRVVGETVVQLHGTGPFEVYLGSPDAAEGS